MWRFAVVILSFSLDAKKHGHRLAINDEPCKSSCDDGENEECDRQSATGDWELSCDMHPTTSCDADCSYKSPPPLQPWLENGTYPSPPPALPPPLSDNLFWIIVVLLVLAASMLAICCIFYGWRKNGSSDAPIEAQPMVPLPSLNMM